MDDVELEVLRLAHLASGKLVKGFAVSPLEELSLHAVVKMLEPALSPVEKKRTRDLLLEIARLRTPATCRFGGGFFR